MKTSDVKPLSAYRAADGDVLWWIFPPVEPPYFGTPSDEGWPGYHTHWSPLPKAVGCNEVLGAERPGKE